MALPNTLQRLEHAGIYVVAALMPFQWAAVPVGAGPHPTYLSLVDPVVWLLGGIFLIERFVSGSLRRITWPPLPVWLFLVWTGVSAAVSYEQAGSFGAFARTQGKELFQLSEYMFVGYVLFRNIAADRGRLRRLFWVVGAASVIAALWALVQLIGGSPAPRVGGGFDNRSALGALVAMLAPLGIGMACKSRDPLIQAVASLPAILGLAVITAGGAYLALLAGLLVTAASLGTRRLVYVAASALAVMTLVFAVALPGQRAALFRSLAPFVEYPPESGEILVALRYRRWHANAGMIADAPILGVGPGRYQQELEQYYGDGIAGKEPGDTSLWELYNVHADEPGSHSWFFVTACQTGLPGLWLLLWMLAYFLGQAIRAGPREGAGEDGPMHEDLGAGLIGTMVAVAILGVFTNPMVRGLGLVSAFVFASASFLAARRGTGEDAEAAPLAPGGSSAMIPKPDFTAGAPRESGNA